MKSIRIREVEHVINRLKDARQTATMETASFSLSEGMGNEKDTEAIREATDLWRRSWILTPIDEAIEVLQGELYRRQA